MYFVEGNIGTGKSTLLEILETQGNRKVIYEPVSEWTSLTNANGKNLLEEFYSDQERYAYTFQSIAFRTRMKNIKNSSLGDIVERSIFTDRNVFAKTCYEQGKMNDIEWKDYCEWFDWLSEGVQPEGYIYLRADPQVSYERIRKRNRGGEEMIPFEYIEELHNKHEKWLMNEKNVIILDANKDFESDPTEFLSKLEVIQ